MDANLYVPIVKSKAGEMAALQNLTDDVRLKILPLIDLTAPSTETQKNDPSKFIERNISKLPSKLKGFEWVMIDSSEMDPNLRLPNGSHPLIYAATALVDKDVRVTPVVSLSHDEAHIAACLEILKNNGNGNTVCIRVEDYDIETPTDSAAQLISLVNRYFKDAALVMLYDSRCVFGKNIRNIVNRAYELDTKLGELKIIGRIFSGCSIPNSISDVIKTRESGYLDRQEIVGWKGFREKFSDGGAIMFGDYTIVNPNYVELDWKKIYKRIGPKIIYTLDKQWFIIRGGSFQKSGREQYYDLAKSVTKLPEYPGETYSFGDSFIGQKSKHVGTPGSPQKWLTAGVNRHITTTARLL